MDVVLRGDIRGKVHSLGQKHVNDVCPLPGVLTRDYGSYSMCTLFFTQNACVTLWRWKCMLWNVYAQWWGVGSVRVWGSVREWCLAQDNFPTTAAIYHPTPTLLFPCTKSCLVLFKRSRVEYRYTRMQVLNFTSLFKGAFLANDPANR